VLALRILDYFLRTALAILSISLAAGFASLLWFAWNMGNAGAGISESHIHFSDSLIIATTFLYFVFCFVSVFPFLKGRGLWVSGSVAHLFLVPIYAVTLPHAGQSENFHIKIALFFPIVWWFMCFVRLSVNGRLKLQREEPLPGSGFDIR
jgi:uncharacterized membrane protein YjgN (DUF898 family)